MIQGVAAASVIFFFLNLASVILELKAATMGGGGDPGGRLAGRGA